MNRYKKLLTSSAILMIGNLGTKFGSLFLLPIYTKYLSTSEYGVSDLSITFINLLLPIITMSIFEMFMKDVIQQPTKKFFYLKNAGFLLIFTNGSAWIVGQILYILGYINLNYSIFLLMLCLMTLQTFNSLLSNYLRAINKNMLYTVMNILQTLFLICFSIIMLQNLELGLIGYFYANVGAYVSIFLFSIPIIFFYKEKVNQKFNYDYSYIKHLIQKSSPLIPNALMWWGINSADKVFILLILGTSASGIFAAANKLPMFVTMLSTVFFQAWQVSAIEEIQSDKKEEFYTIVFQAFLFLMNIGVLCLYIFMQPIGKLLFSSNFINAIDYIPFLILATYFSNLASFLGATCIAEGETRFVFFSSILCALVNIVLSPIFIKNLGLHGAGLSAAISFLFLAYLRFNRVRKTFGINLSPKAYFGHLLIAMAATILLTITKSIGVIIFMLLLYVAFQWNYFNRFKKMW